MEYNNKFFNQLFYPLNDNGKIFRKNDEIFNSALAIVDRVMRTIRGLLNRFFVSRNSFNWVDHLEDIEKNYNGTYHSTIRQIPDDVFYDRVKPFFEVYKPVERLPIGCSVRIKTSLKKNIFDRKYLNKWSDEIYIIEKYDGLGYVLNGGKRKYQREELLPDL